MSMSFYQQKVIRRLALGQIFGQMMQMARQASGRSVDEAARLAGMEASQWMAIEAGFVPDLALLRPMADALELSFEQMAIPVRICREAWGA